MISPTPPRLALLAIFFWIARMPRPVEMILPFSHELDPIWVNAVSPGVIHMPWWDNQPEDLKPASFARITASVLVRRGGRSEDVADAIVYLAGAGYATGVIVDVDGGLRGASPD